MKTKRNGNIHNKRKKTKRIHYGGEDPEYIKFNDVLKNHFLKNPRAILEPGLQSFSKKESPSSVKPFIERPNPPPLSPQVVSSNDQGMTVYERLFKSGKLKEETLDEITISTFREFNNSIESPRLNGMPIKKLQELHNTRVGLLSLTNTIQTAVDAALGDLNRQSSYLSLDDRVKQMKWINCEGRCMSTVKDLIEKETSSTLYMLRVLSKSVVSGGETSSLIFKFEIDESNNEKLSGVWENDKQFIRFTFYETDKQTRDKKKSRLIMGFGPSAAGKTYSAQRIIELLSTTDPAFPTHFLTIDGGDFRECSLVYELTRKIAKKDLIIAGFDNLVSPGVVSEAMHGNLFDSGSIKKAVKSYLEYQKQERPEEVRISLYIPETLGYCGIRGTHDCKDKSYEKYVKLTEDKNGWIGLFIWQHKSGKECDKSAHYKCLGCTESGEERDVLKDGKKYSSDAYDNSLKNGLREYMRAPGGRFNIHNSGGQMIRDDNGNPIQSKINGQNLLCRSTIIDSSPVSKRLNQAAIQKLGSFNWHYEVPTTENIDLMYILGKDSIAEMPKSVKGQNLDDFIADALSPDATNSIASFDDISIFEIQSFDDTPRLELTSFDTLTPYTVDTQLGSGKSGAILLKLKADEKTCILKIYDIQYPHIIPYSEQLRKKQFDLHKQNPFNEKYFRAMKDIAINTIVSTKGFSPAIKGYGLVDFGSIYPVVKSQMESRIKKQGRFRVFNSDEKNILSSLNKIAKYTQDHAEHKFCYPFLIMEELTGYDLLGAVKWVNEKETNSEAKMFIFLFILHRIAFIMNSLNSIQLCHRDLHPGNVLITINDSILNGKTLSVQINEWIKNRQISRARELIAKKNSRFTNSTFYLIEPIEELDVYKFLLSVFTVEIIDFDLSKLSTVSEDTGDITLKTLVGADNKAACTRVYTTANRFKGNWIKGTHDFRRTLNRYSMDAPPASMRQNADLNAWANMYITLLNQSPLNGPRLPENIASFYECLGFIDKVFINTIGACKVGPMKDNKGNIMEHPDGTIRLGIKFVRPMQQRRGGKRSSNPSKRRTQRKRK